MNVNEILSTLKKVVNKQDKNDNRLLTNSKEIVGAINENKLSLEETKTELYNVETKEFKQKRTANLNPIIVCYGDSNTRFYLGDSSKNGSLSYAFSSWIDELCSDYPDYFGSVVINAGYPSQTIQYGLSNYATNVTNNNPNIVIIGFGTNNIKQPSETLESYINNMTTMIDKLLNDGIVPIIMGIPWFAEAYAGKLMQDRLPIWNEKLRDLCIGKNVEFVDTYNMFSGDYADTWFNEVSTPKRHYSPFAAKKLGEELFARILKINYLFSTKKENAINIKQFNINSLAWVNSLPTNISFIDYVNGKHSISCCKIVAGQKIAFNCGGRSCITIYPRINSKITISGIEGEILITPTLDEGLNYPFKRIVINDIIANFKEITINVLEGELYISQISCEEIPHEFKKDSFNYTASYSATTLSTLVLKQYSEVFCSDLLKRVSYYVQGKWLDASGYICIGATSDRTSSNLTSNIPVGYKFWDTTEGKMYRWRGSSWS